MSQQTIQSAIATNKPLTPAGSACTQLNFSDVELLAGETDAVIDRSTTPYVEGEHGESTPIEYVRPIGEILGGFDLDPCASKQSMLASVSIREAGGLKYDWGSNSDTAFVNPPYGEKVKWLNKILDSIGDMETIVALLPGYTSSEWYQQFAPAASLVWHIGERISFDGEHDARFHPVYFVFGDYPAELVSYFEDNGFLVETGARQQNTINVSESVSHDLLDDLGHRDTIKLEFVNDGFPEAIDQEVTLSPYCQYMIAPDESKYPITTMLDRGGTDPVGNYIELTCIQRDCNSTDQLVALGQSTENPQIIKCSVATSRSWHPCKLKRVTVMGDRKETTDHLPTPPTR
jgi:hypothetical protein